MSGSQGRLPFGAPPAPAPADAPAPAPAPPSEKETKAAKLAKGELSHGRQKEIERDEGKIMHYVHNWETRQIVSASAIAKMKYSQRDMITENMRPILHVLKDEHYLKQTKGQFRNLFGSSMNRTSTWGFG